MSDHPLPPSDAREQVLQRLQAAEKRCRRLVVGLVVSLLLLLAVVGGSIWLLWQQHQERMAAEARREAEQARRRAMIKREVEDDLRKVDEMRTQARWADAQATVEKADALLRDDGPEELRDRVRKLREELDQVRRDQELLQRLEDARLRGADGKDRGVAEQHRQAFRDWGLDPEELPSEEVSKRIRTSAIGPALTDALDDWARVSRKGAAERLRAVASLTDSDPWRRQVRKALADKDREAIQRLAEDAGAAQQTPSGIILLADALHNVGMDEQRLAVLREGQRRHPGDFWLAHEVAQACSAVEPPQLEEATRFYVASLTLRPQSAAVHVSLGNTMLARQRFAEAIASFREAIRLKPDDADAHYGLAVALHKQGKLNEAIAEYRETLRLDPKRKEALENLDRLLKSEKPR